MKVKQVSILAYNKVSLFELACAVELFAIPRPEFEQWYQAEVITFENRELELIADMTLTCKHANDLRQTDLLVVPSWPISQTEIDPVLSKSILDFYHQGGRIISFCSGSFLLGRLGILDGKSATTHWRYADAFKQEFPKVNYVDDVLYVKEDRIGCSAGSASAIDLGIDIIRHDFGFGHANSVARRLVLPAHRAGGQKQFVEKTIPRGRNSFSETLDWAVMNISEDLTIDQLAKRANLTRRTFDRRFRHTFNQTPTQWLIERKLEIAKGRLESTEDSLESIAGQAGFANAITMRHNFNKYLAITPSQYRIQFKQNL